MSPYIIRQQFIAADGCIIINEGFEEHLIGISFYKYQYMRRIHQFLFRHRLVLFEERCKLLAVILHVEHKVEHELAKGQFHVASIFVQIF